MMWAVPAVGRIYQVASHLVARVLRTVGETIVDLRIPSDFIRSGLRVLSPCCLSDRSARSSILA